MFLKLVALKKKNCDFVLHESEKHTRTMNMIVETRLQIQRRLAQNREAARKSRIRKKV